MRRVLAAAVAAALLGVPSHSGAQAVSSVEPFKVATVDIGGREAVALVLRDQYVVELTGANRNLEMTGNFATVSAPDNMLELIGQYEYGLKHRIYEIVNHVVGKGQLTGARRPAYIHDAKDVRFLAPIRYPGKMMNAAGNFFSHTCEACTPEQRAEARTRRMANRGLPYLFYKSTRGAIIGHEDEIVLPHGRDRTDWEVELGIVIGRTARYVTAEKAKNYVFGYTVHNDVSDRGGRPPGGTGNTSDWLVGKGAETFAPLGPWITPAEFYGDPTKKLHMQLFIDGKLVQEARVEDMIHNAWELIEYASSIITLHPGDVINSGTTSGTSSGAMFAGTRTGFLKPGEVIEAKIEGIGTIRNKVVAGQAPPKGSGSMLPPVASYPRPSPPPPPPAPARPSTNR
jgi:2-keto-4-pentenoate hydratase/2-oxohepta-3-ene-1,7-dioic acid hydratase in catechol pathway